MFVFIVIAVIALVGNLALWSLVLRVLNHAGLISDAGTRHWRWCGWILLSLIFTVSPLANYLPLPPNFLSVLNFPVVFIDIAGYVLVLATGLGMAIPRYRRPIVFSLLCASLCLVAVFIPSLAWGGNPLHSMRFLVIQGTLGAVQYFFYARLSRGLELSPSARGWLIVFLWLPGISFLTPVVPSHTPLGWFIYGWIGLAGILITILLVETVFSAIWKRYRPYWVRGAVAIWLISIPIALYNGFSSPTIVRHTLPIKGLSKELTGLRVVQLSDLHLDDTFWVRRFLDGMVTQTLALKPDLIVITGDVFEGGMLGDTRPILERLRRLKAPMGVWAVSGNHDDFMNSGRFVTLCRQGGIRTLQNQSIQLSQHLYLAGLDDRTGRLGGKSPGMDQTFHDIPKGAAVILLSHRPDVFVETQRRGVSLQLSGHTHRGQIPPTVFIIPLMYRYPYGLFQKEESYIYTTSGTRLWGFPLRLFSHNEMILFTLMSPDPVVLTPESHNLKERSLQPH